ncbi:glycoside hydrolase [Mesorhizobium sp. C120A]|uniref:glycoside hydrolase family protein n=1 Tax=unclassified Mesorhizobium TaxID=325217 RepID=UPI0003CFEED1|nr:MULTISPECIES: glycoside hydrolase [unclassified Mesorhizobium]ESZ63525.1 glycoside hydrolase [Mesorhizobium sp. L103C120A0]WJI45119.1 glycoside hydrolase [Mesorhizobium sp. C120A]
MPVGKIKSSNRARAAIAAVTAVASLVGGRYIVAKPEPIPAAVQLAVDAAIMPWEGLVLTSHWDRYSNRWDICHGDTLIDGKPVKPGMRFTAAQCHDLLIERVTRDYYVPLTKCIAGFDTKPISLQAALISGAYNFGVGSREKRSGLCGSRAADFTRSGDYYTACLAQTAFNKAGKGKQRQVVKGLVLRREMGDAQRIGEAELCVSGLER